jgi:hypothetical protein
MIERTFIYFPERRLAATPADLGLEFEDLRFRAADGTRLHGWLVPGGGEHPLLWFHGNAGNIGDRVALLCDLHRELGVSIFILEYRGYGDSEGTPSEAGLYLDAEAALNTLAERLAIPAGRVVLFGQSLGAAVGVELASHHPPAGLILESPFTSVADMAKHHYPWLPIWPLLRSRFDSLARIASVSAPLLLIHGADDEIVPPRIGEKLFAAAPEPKQLLLIAGAGHNDAALVGRSQYFAALREFLAKLEAGRPGDRRERP